MIYFMAFKGAIKRLGGAAAGAGMGYLKGGVPGAVVGAYEGYKSGNIDTSGIVKTVSKYAGKRLQ